MPFLNDPLPWTAGIEHDLSIIDLLASATLPAAAAATMWWALEQGASILTAGGPSGAGKSTLANALLPFLPDDAQIYTPGGRGDPLAIPSGAGPSYLLISEFSEHGRPWYLAGPTAQRAFALLQSGVRMVGTLHADSVEEAVLSLQQDLAIPADDVARVTLIAIVRVYGARIAPGRFQRLGPDLARRVVEIGLLAPTSGSVRVTPIAAWNDGAGLLEEASSPAGTAALAAWAGVSAGTAAQAIDEREAALTELLDQGRRDPHEVASAVQRFRRRPAD